MCDVTLQVNGHEHTPILGKLDEAWQCTYADLGALGALPAKWSVGDPGQVAPVVTGSTERWEGQASGPHQPAPAALLAAHGEAITVHELTNSWRLGPQTCALVSQHFYPQMPFTSRRPDEAVIAPDGTVLPEIISRPTEARNGPTDPALLSALTERVRELTWHDYRRGGVCQPLTLQDDAVVVPHVAQAGAADRPGHRSSCRSDLVPAGHQECFDLVLEGAAGVVARHRDAHQ